MKNNKIKLFVFCIIVLLTLSCSTAPTEPEPIEPIIIEKPIKTEND